MTPVMRALRYMLFLPIEEADKREQAVRDSSCDLQLAVDGLTQASNNVREKSSDLRRLMNSLLGEVSE